MTSERESSPSQQNGRSRPGRERATPSRSEILTHTKRRDFKNCPRYFFHRHIEHLAPRKQKRGRRRGHIFGDLLAACQETFGPQDSRAAMQISDSIEALIDQGVEMHYEHLRDTGLLDPDELAALDIEEVQMRVIARRYIEKYGVDPRREVEFYVPLVNPKTGRSSRAFRLGGKIDGVRSIGTRHAVIIEDKLVGQIQRAMIERLPLDDQISEYADAFHGKGWDVDVWYRHTRWPSIEPRKPKEFKTKDNYPGETLLEYETRLYQDTHERPDFYFDQQIIHFPVGHLDDYRRGRWNTGQKILLAKRALRSGAAYQDVFEKNPSRCWEYGGCEFIPLCTLVEDARSLYEVTKDNPELTQEGVTVEYGQAEA